MDGSNTMKASNTYKPGAWRWLNAKSLSSKSLAKVLDEEDNFCFHLNSSTPRGMPMPTLFLEANDEIKLLLSRNLLGKSVNSIGYSGPNSPPLPS